MTWTRHEYVDRFAVKDVDENEEYDNPNDFNMYQREIKEKENKDLKKLAKMIEQKMEKIGDLQSELGELKERYLEDYNSLPEDQTDYTNEHNEE